MAQPTPGPHAHSWPPQLPSTSLCVTATHAQASRALPQLLRAVARQTQPPAEVLVLLRGVSGGLDDVACRDAWGWDSQQGLAARARQAFPSVQLICSGPSKPRRRKHADSRPPSTAVGDDELGDELANARQTLAQRATADLVSFVSAEDVLVQTRLQLVALAFQRQPSLQAVLHRVQRGSVAPFAEELPPSACVRLDGTDAAMPTVRTAALRLGLRYRLSSSSSGGGGGSSGGQPAARPSIHDALDAALVREITRAAGGAASGAGAACAIGETLAMARPSPDAPSPRPVAMRLHGGLGNRMFQLQGLLGVAAASSHRSGGGGGSSSHGELVATVYAPDLSLLHEVFDLDASRFVQSTDSIESMPLHRHTLRERSVFEHSPNFERRCSAAEGCRLEGFLQSTDYLKPLEPLGLRGPSELHKLWRVREEHVRAARALVGGARPGENRSWVGVHVRRFPPTHADGVPSAASLRAAVEAAVLDAASAAVLDGASGRPPCVMVFSNDPAWAVEQLRVRDGEPGPPTPPCLHAAPNECKDPLYPRNQAVRRCKRLLRPGNNASRGDAWATQAGRDLAAMAQLCDRLVLTSGTFGVFSAMLHGARRGPVWAWVEAGTRKLHQPGWRLYS